MKQRGPSLPLPPSPAFVFLSFQMYLCLPVFPVPSPFVPSVLRLYFHRREFIPFCSCSVICRSFWLSGGFFSFLSSAYLPFSAGCCGSEQLPAGAAGSCACAPGGSSCCCSGWAGMGFAGLTHGQPTALLPFFPGDNKSLPFVLFPGCYHPIYSPPPCTFPR